VLSGQELEGKFSFLLLSFEFLEAVFETLDGDQLRV
jgi:hypothetical protein